MRGLQKECDVSFIVLGFFFSQYLSPYSCALATPVLRVPAAPSLVSRWGLGSLPLTLSYSFGPHLMMDALPLPKSPPSCGFVLLMWYTVWIPSVLLVALVTYGPLQLAVQAWSYLGPAAGVYWIRCLRVCSREDN